MTWKTIIKSERDWRVRPNFTNYEQARKAFSWDDARRDLERLGLKKGDRVYVLAGRIPELYIAALGTLKHGCIFCPLFSAFGPEPIRARLAIGKANVLVTTESLYERKINTIRSSVPFLNHVLVVGDNHEPTNVPNTTDYHRAMEVAGKSYAIQPTASEDIALLHFASGTTGTPKGAVHIHGAVIAHHTTGKLALDFHCDDVFWCTADPGWVTGTSYGMIAPLTNGITSIIDEGGGCQTDVVARAERQLDGPALLPI